MSGGIVQSGVPPYEARCWACGAEWYGKPARGATTPTEASLDREATRHWAECPGPPAAAVGAPESS